MLAVLRRPGGLHVDHPATWRCSRASSTWFKLGLKKMPGACSSLLTGKTIITVATRPRWTRSTGSGGSGCQSNRMRPRKNALRATMSVWARYFMESPLAPMATSSASIRWSEGLVM